MSVVTFPRIGTPTTTRRSSETVTVGSLSGPRRRRRQVQLPLPRTARAWSVTVMVLTLVAMLMSITICQNWAMTIDARKMVLVDSQASYAASVSSVSSAIAPEQVANELGAYRLVTPRVVAQIQRVSLAVPLAAPRIIGGYRPVSRILSAQLPVGTVTALHTARK